MTGKPSILLAIKEEDTVELISTCLTKKIGEMGASRKSWAFVNTPFDEESPRIYDDSYYFSLPMDGLDTERQIYSNVK